MKKNVWTLFFLLTLTWLVSSCSSNSVAKAPHDSDSAKKLKLNKQEQFSHFRGFSTR
ncbi:MAG: hypothetical protein GY909_16655 [Oligoflexia bacterium]|nr:hypothetical protein [Oligoflexia bacterium]